MATLHDKVHALEKAFKEERRRKLPVAPHPAELGFAYVLELRTEHWDKLAKIAATQIKAAHAGIAKLRLFQTRLSSLSNGVEAILPSIELSTTALNKRGDWDKVATRIKATLEKTLTQQKAASLVAELGKKTLLASKDQVFAPLDSSAEAINRSLRSWHAMIMAASFALAIDKFNRKPARDVVRIPSSRQFLKLINAQLASERKNLHKSLRSANLIAIKKSAGQLLQFTTGESFKELVVLSSLIAATRNKDGGDESLAQLGLTCGNLIREFLLAQANALRIDGLAMTGRGDIHKWIDAASELDFDSATTSDSVTDLSELSTRPALFNGKTISVRGVVAKVENKHRGAKVLSTVTLKSIADGATVLAGISHIKLDSGGVVPGSYAQFTGVFSRDDDIFHQPMVRVDRRQLKAEGEESWSAWAQFNLRDIFVPVAHGLLATATWEKGFNGAANPLRYGTWRDQEEGL
jgi:hypothetical protein